ncbi:hypothetical protein B0H66DRAFT_522319 [Apodospora peruviana]|uniref:DUF6603 domain-containing protein n=1 Tax=Apodospora peruviana TaxID=516989 RepID=A0AAE0M073_9PEZI|nr:hypothetical protein B0H66DRAFT_522319 [Apodospora peruviana]
MPWEVHSHHLNINEGDCAVHLVVASPNNNGTYNINKAVLIDGGRSEGADHIKSFVHLCRNNQYIRYGGTFQFFHSVVVTHWDGDHKDGLERYFDNELKMVLNAAIALHQINDPQVLQNLLNNFTITPTSVRADSTRWYAPYWVKGNRKVTDTCIPPSTWRLGAGNALYIRVEVSLFGGGGQAQVEMPMGVVTYGGDNDGVLACDIFTHQRIFADPENATSPETVAVALNARQNDQQNDIDRTRPAMFCVAVDEKFCGTTELHRRFNNYSWDWQNLGEMKLVRNVNNIYANPSGVEESQETGIQSIRGRTTSNNLASIVSMIIWPAWNASNLSYATHYIGGDAGDDIEEKVLYWAAEQEQGNQNIFWPINVPAMKLSHHGAKFSTPIAMLPAWRPRSIVCSNGMHQGHNHIAWPTAMLVRAWCHWRATYERNNYTKRLYCLNYPVYFVPRWKVASGAQGALVPVMKMGALKPLKDDDRDAENWRILVTRLLAEGREIPIKLVRQGMKSFATTGAVLLSPQMKSQWNSYSAIDDDKYTPNAQLASSTDYSTQFVRDVEVVQSADDPAYVRYYQGQMLAEDQRHATGAWDFNTIVVNPPLLYAQDEDSADEWECIGGSGTESWDSDSDDIVLLDGPSEPRRQKPMNKRTTAPWYCTRENFRPLVNNLVSERVGRGLNRAVWGDAASDPAAKEDSDSIQWPAYNPQDEQALEWLSHNRVDPLCHLVSTTTTLKDNDPLNQAAAVRDSPLDLLLERLTTGALVLSTAPIAQRKSIPLDDSDELLHFLRDIFSPVTDGTCRVGVDLDSTGVHGFEATLDLTDLLAAKQNAKPTPPKTLRAMRATNTLTFKSAYNGTAFKALEGGTHPSWVVGGTANSPDCIGPAQMILMGLDPDAPSPQYSLEQILRLVDIKDNGMSRYFSLLTKFELANDAGSRNALWFIPLSSHTATLRLVFKPAESGNLTAFKDNILKTVRDYTGLEKLDVTEPCIVAKRTWTQAVGSLPPTSTSELAFAAKITFASKSATLTLNSTLVIEQYSVVVVVSFGEKNQGLTPDQLLTFIAETFTGNNEVPLKDFFPNAALENVRLLRIVYQMNERSKFVSLDFQINWASLVLKVTVTYNFTSREFGMYGNLFPENRPSKLPEVFNYRPYLPDYEEWTILSRTSVGTAQIQAENMEGIARLDDIYRQLTSTTAKADDGETLTPGPFEMELLELNWSLEGSVISFGATVVCPERVPGKKYRLPPIQFTAGSLDLKFDYKDKADKIKRIAVAGAEEDDPDDESKICNCTVGLEYADKVWTLGASVTGLSGSMLYSIFDDDCNHEVTQLLKTVFLDLSIVYRYDKAGEGSSFLITGALYISSLELRCTYLHEGDKEWQFSADVALGNQKASLIGLAQALFGVDDKALPPWVGDVEAKSNALRAAEASSLASLEIVALADRLVMMFRFRLGDGTTVVFYQTQEKKKQDEKERKKPKRALMLSVEGLPGIPPIPMVGTIKQPFEKLDFVWVLDSNTEGQGLTRADIKALGMAVDKSVNSALYPRLRYQDTIKKGSENDADVLLAPGFHFVVSNMEKVMLDYTFGNKKKDKDKKKPDSKALCTGTSDLYTEGDTATTPINKMIGPVTLLGLGLGFNLETNTLSLALDGTLELGPLGFTLIGFEVSFTFEKGATLRNPGPIKPSFSLSGLGASFERDPIVLAGLFERGKMPNGDVYYQGAASVGFAPYVFRAAGYYGENTEQASSKAITHHHHLEKFASFLIYCTLEGPLFTIGYAEVRGLTGGFGYNTCITLPTVDSVLKFPFLTVPKSSSPDSTQGAQTSLIKSGWFATKKGSYWVAAGVTVLAFQMLSVSAVVVVEWNPSVKLGLFGVATAEMPRQAQHKFARVQLALAATVDFESGVLRVDGQLTPASFVLDPHCHLSGGFALYAWFGSKDPSMQGSWVFTVGGYHPRFIAPQQFPVGIPRLGISWSFDRYVSISGEAYFAITPKVCMGGGRLHVTMSIGPLDAYFDAYADFLIQYRPFRFETSGGLSVGVRYTLDLWLVSINISVDIAARLYLEGPPVRGVVHVDFWVFGFDVSFGKKEIASGAPILLDDFYDLVLQAEARQPALLPMAVGEGDVDEEVAPAAVAHILSCTSGIVADNATSAPKAGDPWRVRGAVFAFTVASKFVFDGYDVVTVIHGQKDHKHSPPCPGKGQIYARPMGLEKPIHSSSVKVTITRQPVELLAEEEDDSPNPVWNEVICSTAALPTALWGKVNSSDPLDGRTDTVVNLPNSLALYAPGANMSKDKIAEFNVAKSMGSVAYETDFLKSVPMSKEWDPAPPFTPPEAQYHRVEEVWEEKGKTVAAEFAEFWCNLPVFGWVGDDKKPAASGMWPEKLVKVLEVEYTEAPRMTRVSVASC